MIPASTKDFRIIKKLLIELNTGHLDHDGQVKLARDVVKASFSYKTRPRVVPMTETERIELNKLVTSIQDVLPRGLGNPGSSFRRIIYVVSRGEMLCEMFPCIADAIRFSNEFSRATEILDGWNGVPPVESLLEYAMLRHLHRWFPLQNWNILRSNVKRIDGIKVEHYKPY